MLHIIIKHFSSSLTFSPDQLSSTHTVRIILHLLKIHASVHRPVLQLYKPNRYNKNVSLYPAHCNLLSAVHVIFINRIILHLLKKCTGFGYDESILVSSLEMVYLPLHWNQIQSRLDFYNELVFQ